MTNIEHSCPNCDGVGHLFTVEKSKQVWASECPVCEGRGKVVSTHRYWGAVDDLRVAVDLLSRSRCADLGTDDKSWWSTQRKRLAAKWGQ